MERWGGLRAEGARRVASFEREFRTDPADLWNAITDPERAGRWLGSLTVNGDAVTIGFAGGSSRSGSVLECRAPERLRVVLDPGAPNESHLTVALAPTATGTSLTMQQDGFPPILAALFTGGWQHHAELLDVLVGGDATPTPFPDLIAAYREAEARAVAGWLTATDDGTEFELERLIDADEDAVRAALPTTGPRVAIALSPIPTGTRLRLRTEPEPVDDPAALAAGWHATVDALVAGLAGIPLPEGDALRVAAYAVYSTPRDA